jgi:CBS domain-containing protein
MTPATVFVTPATRTSEAAALLDESGADALPVVDANGAYLGLVARSDLVQDLVRPFKPPLVGGMATPLGVYLTTGQARAA